MPRKNDCAIRAVSAACGFSYNIVSKTLGPLPKGGLESHELHWLISQFKSDAKRSVSKLDLGPWLQRNRNGVYVVSVGSGLGLAHAVAVSNGIVLGEDCPAGWPVLEYWKIS